MGFPQAPEHRMVVGDGKVRGYSMGEAHGVLWLQFQGVLQLRESYSLARRSTGACWASNPGRGAWIGRFEAFAVRWYCSQRLLSVGHHSPQTSLDAFSKWHIKHNSRNCCVGGVSKVAVSAVFFLSTISQSQRSSTPGRPSHDVEIRGNALMDASLTLPWSLRADLASAWSFLPVPWHDVGPFLLMILDPRLPFGWHFIRQQQKNRSRMFQVLVIRVDLHWKRGNNQSTGRLGNTGWMI